VARMRARARFERGVVWCVTSCGARRQRCGWKGFGCAGAREAMHLLCMSWDGGPGCVHRRGEHGLQGMCTGSLHALACYSFTPGETEIEICTPERTRAWTQGAVGWASRMLSARIRMRPPYAPLPLPGTVGRPT
jgi:hypothetical protein